MRIRVETCHPFALWRWSCRPIDLIPKTKSPTTVPNSLWFFLVESHILAHQAHSLRSWLDDLEVPIRWSCSPWKWYSINRSYTISIYSVYIYILYIYYIYMSMMWYIYIYDVIHIHIYIYGLSYHGIPPFLDQPTWLCLLRIAEVQARLKVFSLGRSGRNSNGEDTLW